MSKSLLSICAKRMHICRSLWRCSVRTSLGPFKHIQTPCGMSAQLVGSCIATSHIGLAGHVRTGHPTRIGLLGNRLIWLDATKSLISLSLSPVNRLENSLSCSFLLIQIHTSRVLHNLVQGWHLGCHAVQNQLAHLAPESMKRRRRRWILYTYVQVAFVYFPSGSTTSLCLGLIPTFLWPVQLGSTCSTINWL